MTIARINTASDATWTRSWEVADAAELATLLATFSSIGGPKRGDVIVQLDTGIIYLLVNANLVVQISNLAELQSNNTFTGTNTFPSLTLEDGADGPVILAPEDLGGNPAIQIGGNFVPSSDDAFNLGVVGREFAGVNSNLVTTDGVQFPATQVPSADANRLDDYEEGSWTPSVQFGGGSTGITYSTQVGSYVKIGQLVFASFFIVLTSKGSSTGAVTINGLPFTSSAISNVFGVMAGSGSYANFVGLTGALTGAVNNNATSAALQQSGATGVANLDDTNFSNTTVLISGYLYRAAA